MGFNTMNQRSGMNGGNQRLDEIFGPLLFDWKEAAQTQCFRPHGPIIAYEFYWFDIIGEKTQKLVSIPKLCLDLDPYTDTYISDDCPYRASGQGRKSRIYLVNAIWRKAQDNMPAKLKSFRASEKKLVNVIGKTPDFPKGWEAYAIDYAGGSESWTPNRVLCLTARNSLTVAELSKENVYKGTAYDVADVDNGCDIAVKYDAKGTGTGKFQITRDNESGQTPLSNEEMDFLVIKHDVLTLPNVKEAQADWKEFKARIVKDSEKKEGDGIRGRGRSSASRLDEDVEDDTPRGRGRGRDDDDDSDADNDNERSERGSSRGGKPASRPASGGARARLAAGRRGARRDDDMPF